MPRDCRGLARSSRRAARAGAWKSPTTTPCRRCPRRLTLTHSNGKRAILLVKEREKPAKAFTEEQMRLTLPEGVPLLPLSQYKAQ